MNASTALPTEPTQQTPTPGLPAIRAATPDDIRLSLAEGLDDFRSAPAFGLALGALFALGGILMVWLPASFGHVWAVYPLMAGFVLIGPFAAVGLYEVSRRRETGEPVSVGAVLAAVWRQGGRELAWMSFVALFIFIMWMYQVRLIYALFFGLATLDPATFARAIFTTADGLTFITIGTIVGAAMALLVFSISVISFPLLLDRDVDVITAIITSIKAVALAPKVMLGWGVLTAVALFVAMIPAFLGLIVVLPVWGHATWRLYRRLVAQPA